MQYQKVLHPFDLDLTFLAILRKAFERAELESNTKGMSLDNLTHLIVQTLNVDLNYAQILLRNFDRGLNQRILWRDFLDFLDREGQLREDIIDLKLYDFSLKRFQESNKFDVRHQGISLLDPNSMIENIVKFQARNKLFHLLFFDDGQIFLFDKDIQYMETFFPLDKHPKEFENLELWEFKTVAHSSGAGGIYQYQRPSTSHTNTDAKNTQKSNYSRNTIDEDKRKGSFDIRHMLNRSAFTPAKSNKHSESNRWRHQIDLPESIEDEFSIKEIDLISQSETKRIGRFGFDSTRHKTPSKRHQTADKKSPAAFSKSPKTKKNLSAFSSPIKRKLKVITHFSASLSQKQNARISSSDKKNTLEIKVEDRNKENLSFSEQLQEMQKDFPKVEHFNHQEQKDIRYLFDQFKKSSQLDRMAHVANIGAWAFKNKEYDKAKEMVSHLSQNQPKVAETPLNSKRRKLSAAIRLDSESSRGFSPMWDRSVRHDRKQTLIRVKEDVPEVVSLNELKDKFEKVKDTLEKFEDMQDYKEIEKFRSTMRDQMSTTTHSFSKKHHHQQQHPKVTAHQAFTTNLPTMNKKIGIYEKYMISKSKVFATNGVFHPETGLLVITFLSREARIYSPRYRFEDFLFLEKHRLKFSSVPLFIVFSMHSKVKQYVMGIATEDAIYVFKVNTADRGEFYIEKEPIFKASGSSYKIKEPVGFMFCSTVGMIVAGVNSSIEVYEETVSEEGYYKLKNNFKIKSGTVNHALTTSAYSKELRLIALGNSKGSISLVDPIHGATRASYTSDNIPVVKIHFVNMEKTLVGVYQDKRVILLNAETMQVLQILRDRDIHRPHNIIKTSLYDNERGLLMIAGAHAKTYKLQEDSDIELVKRDIEVRRHFAPQRDAMSNGAYKDYKYLFNGGKKIEITRKEIFRAFYIGPQSNNENPHCLYIVEKNRALKIYDLKTEKYKFTFFMKLNTQIAAAAVSKDGKFIAVSDANGLVKLYNVRSGDCIEELFHSKSDIQLLEFLPKENVNMLVATGNDGELTLFNSEYKGSRDKRNHDSVVGHLKCITALDMSEEFIATADEVNEVKIWSAATFHNIFTIRIPSEYDPQMCFEFVDGAAGHKHSRNDSNIIDLRFLKEHVNEHVLFVLEARGCVHILNAKEGKVMQVHAVNIGPNACFDLEYDVLGMRLYSFDSDLSIRIFYKSEGVDLDEFKSQALNPMNFDRKESIVKRRVTFVRDDSLDSSQFNSLEISPVLNVPRKTVHKNIFAANTRKRNKAVFNRNTEEDDADSSVMNPDKIGWAFYLVTKISYPKDTIPRNVEPKNIQIIYVEEKKVFLTVVNYGDILIWNRTGVYEGKLVNKDVNTDTILPSTILSITNTLNEI